MGLGFCSAITFVSAVSAQIPLPAAKPPDGAALFKQQCATCHTTNLSDATRQGPTLAQIIGRKAGKVEGFHYSPSLAQADFTWDENRLDAWLANPQAVVPGAIMPYRQARAETRTAIITYLKGLN
ncbi:MAG TPA: c-type cytochrome [Hyphomicrobium sp.]